MINEITGPLIEEIKKEFPELGWVGSSMLLCFDPRINIFFLNDGILMEQCRLLISSTYKYANPEFPNNLYKDIKQILIKRTCT